MVGKTIPPTVSEARRMSWIGQQYGNCIPCLLMGLQGVPATVQHVVEGNKRLGHEHTYGSCVWHHLGHPPKRPGPSLAEGKKPFMRHFGSEAVLVTLQDFLIESWGIYPWVPYQVPAAVLTELRGLWRDLLKTDPYWQA